MDEKQYQQVGVNVIPDSVYPHNRIFVITGLPGSGKTRFANSLVKALTKGFRNVVHINADDVRSGITRHLGFSHEDRVRQAETLGNMCKIVANSGVRAVVDFVAPTPETRKAFLEATGMHRSRVLWCAIEPVDFQSRFKDTNNLYQPILREEAESMKVGMFIHTTDANVAANSWVLDKAFDYACEDRVQGQ